MYLLAFSILLLFSALNLKAQESLEEQMSFEGQEGTANNLFVNPALAGGVGGNVSQEEAVNADRHKPLLTDSESQFFNALRRALETVDCNVMAKVNLEDVISTSDLSRQMSLKFEKARNKLERKHVDFVVCWGNELNILVVVRLEPSSRMRPLQKLMQGRIDEVLDAAGIPVVRIQPSETYDDDEILELLTPHLV